MNRVKNPGTNMYNMINTDANQPTHTEKTVQPKSQWVKQISVASPTRAAMDFDVYFIILCT